MKVTFSFSRGASNSHIYPGFHTVHGPKFRYLKLSTRQLVSGRRVIFYFPTGACWYFDMLWGAL